MRELHLDSEQNESVLRFAGGMALIMLQELVSEQYTLELTDQSIRGAMEVMEVPEETWVKDYFEYTCSLICMEKYKEVSLGAMSEIIGTIMNVAVASVLNLSERLEAVVIPDLESELTVPAEWVSEN